jgi:hypothetical protein
MDNGASAKLGDTVDAVLMAIDSKLASLDPLTIDDLHTVEKLVRAKARLERGEDVDR